MSKSNKSPLPRPCNAETNLGSPKPRFHNSYPSASSSALSILFAIKITFLPLFLSKSTSEASSSRAPTCASTTNITKSASLIAASAPAVIFSEIPVGFTSHPPVSIKKNLRPFHSASYFTRSLVTPGVSSTIASLLPIILLTKVDLPTLGRPITATVGKPSKFRCFNHFQICSVTSCSDNLVESINAASSACASGEIALDESI